MSKWTFERAGYVAGAAFPILGIAGVVMNEAGRGSWPGDIERDPITTGKLVEYFNGSVVSRFGYLVLIASAVALMWFVYSLRSRLQRAEGGSGILSRIAYGLGFTSAFAWLLLFVLFAATERYDAAAVDPQILTGIFAAEQLVDGIWFLAIMPLPFLLGIAAYLGFKHRALPRTLSWIGAVAAVPGLLGVLLWPVDTTSDGFFGGMAWVGSLAFLLWCLIGGIVLAASRKSISTSPAAGRPSEPAEPSEPYAVAAI